MNVAATVLVSLGLEAVTFLAVRAYSAREPSGRVLGSLLPLCLIAGVVLTLSGTNG